MPTATRISARTKPSERANGRGLTAKPSPKPAPKTLFRKSCKSLGPRSYSAQVKELANGNQLLVLSDAKRDPQSGDVRKTRLFVHGEDLLTFFRLLNDTAAFMRANPVPEEIRRRREKFWAKKRGVASSR